MDRAPPSSASLWTARASGATVTVGGLNFSCPRCNNPLFFTFKLADEGDSMTRSVACPGCHTNWGVDLSIRPK